MYDMSGRVPRSERNKNRVFAIIHNDVEENNVLRRHRAARARESREERKRRDEEDKKKAEEAKKKTEERQKAIDDAYTASEEKYEEWQNADNETAANTIFDEVQNTIKDKKFAIRRLREKNQRLRSLREKKSRRVKKNRYSVSVSNEEEVQAEIEVQAKIVDIWENIFSEMKIKKNRTERVKKAKEQQAAEEKRKADEALENERILKEYQTK